MRMDRRVWGRGSPHSHGGGNRQPGIAAAAASQIIVSERVEGVGSLQAVRLGRCYRLIRLRGEAQESAGARVVRRMREAPHKRGPICGAPIIIRRRVRVGAHEQVVVPELILAVCHQELEARLVVGRVGHAALRWLLVGTRASGLSFWAHSLVSWSYCSRLAVRGLTCEAERRGGARRGARCRVTVVGEGGRYTDSPGGRGQLGREGNWRERGWS